MDNIPDDLNVALLQFLKDWPLEKTKSAFETEIEQNGPMMNLQALEALNKAIEHRITWIRENVEITEGTRQVKRRFKEVEETTRAQLDKSNVEEYCGSEADAARLDATKFNRTIQMKFDIVHNDDDDLARSTSRLKKDEISFHDIPWGVEERLRNVEEHLQMKKQPIGKDIYKRLKALEDKIIQIEETDPATALIHFTDTVSRKHLELTTLSPIVQVKNSLKK